MGELLHTWDGIRLLADFDQLRRDLPLLMFEVIYYIVILWGLLATADSPLVYGS